MEKVKEKTFGKKKNNVGKGLGKKFRSFILIIVIYLISQEGDC